MAKLESSACAERTDHAREKAEQYANRQASLEILHPYLGFTYNQESSSKDKDFQCHHNPINSLGFIDRDLPRWQKNPDEYVVGVVGGSVAFWMSSLAEDTRSGA